MITKLKKIKDAYMNHFIYTDLTHEMGYTIFNLVFGLYNLCFGTINLVYGHEIFNVVGIFLFFPAALFQLSIGILRLFRKNKEIIK